MKLKILAIVLFFLTFLRFPCLRAEEAQADLKEGKARLITISAGIEMVLKDNRMIKVTLPENDMAYEDSLLARSALLPHLTANVLKTFNQFKPEMKFNSISAPVSNRDPFTYGFDVYQTLFDFGKSFYNYRASREMFGAIKANTESIKRIAVLEFVTAYFNLLETEKLIAVFEKEVESLGAYLNDIEHLYNQGAAVKNDLLPAQVDLADARQRLISARNDREVAVARINNILALPLRENTAVEDIEMQAPEFPEIDGAWNNAQTQRPEIAFYADQIKASMALERAKAVENFPVLFADGGYTYTQNQYQVHQDNLSVNLGAKISLYDGGAARAELLKERARQKQLEAGKDKITEDIKFEIEDSYFGLKDACEKVLVAKDAVAQAEENVRVYRIKYNAGSATPTDVLAAITLQTRAQVNFYRNDYELKRSYAKLMYSMGIDLSLIYSKMESEKK